MRPNLIIISDLWGERHSTWIRQFENVLAQDYQLKFYDACALGEIDMKYYNQEVLHRQFVEFGIKKAAHKLLQLEGESQLYIGCSVGGVIVWKAGLLGLKIRKLFAISSTRLRKEQSQPDFPVRLYFGKSDEYRPGADWMNKMGNDHITILEGGHEIYKERTTVMQIAQELIPLKSK